MPDPKDNELMGAYLAATWAAPDGSAVIARVRDPQGQQVTIKGPGDAGPSLQPGLSYRFHGKWEEHEKYGPQFVFATYSALQPHDKRGVIAYLTSIADNVGPKRAEALWEAYAEFAVQVLRENPERVAEKGIMSLADAKEASQCLHDESAFESTKIDLLELFAGRGFQASRLIKECLKRWQVRAPVLIRRNPYLLMAKRLPSCGWNRCDKLYLDLGHPRTRRKRQTLCMAFELRSDRSGDTWLRAQKVRAKLSDAVGQGANPDSALALGLRAGVIAQRQDSDGAKWLAEGVKAEHERAVARHLRRLQGWKRLSRPVASKRYGQETSPSGEPPL